MSQLWYGWSQIWWEILYFSTKVYLIHIFLVFISRYESRMFNISSFIIRGDFVLSDIFVYWFCARLRVLFFVETLISPEVQATISWLASTVVPLIPILAVLVSNLNFSGLSFPIIPVTDLNVPFKNLKVDLEFAEFFSFHFPDQSVEFHLRYSSGKIDGVLIF